MKLYDVSQQYSKHGRLKEMSDFCESNDEELEDVLFSMLTTLFDKGKAELAKNQHFVDRTD